MSTLSFKRERQPKFSSKEQYLLGKRVKGKVKAGSSYWELGQILPSPSSLPNIC